MMIDDDTLKQLLRINDELLQLSPDWYVGGSVLVPGRSSSIVEITRFQLQQFTVSMKELAEWFGLEVVRTVVDECLPQRGNRMARGC
jgi:hypothetical protein